ncbi:MULTISPECIES: alanine--tRNA ligase [Candidatus Nitrosocaldus]|uniref:Alanine--tRNA ligase n=1 Tax=Candidatus Nitrosocaldus cavascurensis TaxID=2058097 RepID=A0A2K5ASG7_9ARCH|nr:MULTISPECIES: alanine--tRNA ligase [Candidatus Nitrosocaldus]SPC34596.1 Alanine--tRNA ligase [Candidatus Nitrosocaldus cavascurensis]
MSKEELLARFSSEPDRYYRVSLFDDLGFKRQQCSVCNAYFWALNDRERCPNCEPYGFIGNPPTSKRLDYIEAWKAVEDFFIKNGHTSVKRYPVVCRWRDDLFFTVASIVDFQRVIGGKVVFELPANPLIVPQMCLRFNDIENVGRTGKHYTSFCMIGQHSIADAENGYWKDRCIELDYKMLTDVLGIRKDEIVFVEDVWLGYGAFGYSLEYYVRGLELGNAVFTEFEGNPRDYRIMKERVVDMGAGLERFSWVTMGTPTSYDCTFGPVVKHMINRFGVEYDQDLLGRYFKIVSSSSISRSSMGIDGIARMLGVDTDRLERIIVPLEAIYAAADHVRTLTFAVADGALPSNTGGGYNLRVVLRRVLAMLRRLGWSIRLEEIADMHIDYLSSMYPELGEQRESVRTILAVESSRYADAIERMKGVVKRLSGKRLSNDDLIKLYESDGITPDFLKEHGIIDRVPENFYTILAERHNEKPLVEEPKPIMDVSSIEPTRLLFYEDQYMLEFSAKVVKIKMPYVVLDRTAFYARAGGQEPDHGYINEARVVDVIKQGDVILHKIEDAEISFKEGDTVMCRVDGERRGLIMRHHTATHIINAASRKALGPWVWQHSAFKDEDYARLDITHHSPLSRDDVKRIEEYANDIVLADLPIEVTLMDRNVAEQLYGFRIYQGGYVPNKSIRIVKIKDWDIEACGGTHCERSGEVGMVKIIKAERVQDGIVRLEFVAGKAALRYVQMQEEQVSSIAGILGSSKEKVVDTLARKVEEADDARRRLRLMIRRIADGMASSVVSNAKMIKVGMDESSKHYDDNNNTIKLYAVYDDLLDEEYHIAVGEKAIEMEPRLVYCVLIGKGNKSMRVIVFSGQSARKRFKASSVAKSIASIFGGSAGGDDRFAQGGGQYREVKDASAMVEGIILGSA